MSRIFKSSNTLPALCNNEKDIFIYISMGYSNSSINKPNKKWRTINITSISRLVINQNKYIYPNMIQFKPNQKIMHLHIHIVLLLLTAIAIISLIKFNIQSKAIERPGGVMKTDMELSSIPVPIPVPVTNSKAQQE